MKQKRRELTNDMCVVSGKVKLSSKQRAKQKAKWMNSNIARHRLYIYHCQHCGMWHLTSRDREQYRALNAPKEVG